MAPAQPGHIGPPQRHLCPSIPRLYCALHARQSSTVVPPLAPSDFPHPAFLPLCLPSLSTSMESSRLLLRECRCPSSTPSSSFPPGGADDGLPFSPAPLPTLSVGTSPSLLPFAPSILFFLVLASLLCFPALHMTSPTSFGPPRPDTLLFSPPVLLLLLPLPLGAALAPFPPAASAVSSLAWN